MAKENSSQPLTIESVPEESSNLDVTSGQSTVVNINPIQIECSSNSKEKLRASASQPYLKLSNRLKKMDDPVSNS